MVRKAIVLTPHDYLKGQMSRVNNGTGFALKQGVIEMNRYCPLINFSKLILFMFIYSIHMK